MDPRSPRYPVPTSSSLGLHHRYYIAISGSVVIIVWMHMAIATGAQTG